MQKLLVTMKDIQRYKVLKGVLEKKLKGVEANRFLQEEFLPWYNKKYTHETESSYMSLPKDKNLDLVFCIKKERTVNNDNTVSIYGQIIQIPPNQSHLSFTKAKVQVCLLEDKRIYVLYKDKIIVESKLSKDNKVIKKDKEAEEFLNAREYISVGSRRAHKPPQDHPWRKAILAACRQRACLQKINI